MSALSKEQFDRLKNLLYEAEHGLERSLEICPELANLSMKLPDEHMLSPNEALLLLRSVRSYCWRYGPAEVQNRHIKEILRTQPQG